MSIGHSQITGSGYFKALLSFKTKGNQDTVSVIDLLLFRSYNSIVTFMMLCKTAAHLVLPPSTKIEILIIFYIKHKVE